MKIFLCISKDVTYKKILDKIGREHHGSPNLKTLEEFGDAMKSSIPDLIILDKNIEYFENVMQLEGTIKIFIFDGSFPALIDKMSDMFLPDPSQIEKFHQESAPAERVQEEESGEPSESPFFKKLKARKQTKEPGKQIEVTPEDTEPHNTAEESAAAIDDNEEYDFIRKVKQRKLAKENGSEPSSTQREELYDKKRSRFLNHVIGFWCVGSNGKTEISKNLALHLGKNMRVLYLDFNLVNPDVGDHLGIGFPQGKTLYDCLQAYQNNNLTVEVLENMFTDHHGIKVLVGVPDVLTQGDFSDLFFITLIKTVRMMFDIVIVDMNCDLTASAGIQVLSYCNRIFIPLSSSTSPLMHAKAYVNLFEQGQISIDKCEFVLNKYGEGGKVNDELIADTLGKKPVGRLPYNKKHVHSIDSGKPLYLSGYAPVADLCSKIGQGYIEAMKELDPDFQEKEPKLNFFQRLFRRRAAT